MLHRLTGIPPIGGVLTILGVATVWYSLRIDLDPDGSWGARTFPLIAAASVIALGLIEVITARRPPDGGSSASLAIDRNVILLLALSLAYVWLISRVGYLIATGVAAPLALFLFGVRNPLGLATAIFLCPLAFHLVFFAGLGVFPPFGAWFDLLDYLQGN